MGLIAFIYLSTVKKKKAAADGASNDKNLKFRRGHNLLEKLTDPVYNAQYEIGRKLKKIKTEDDFAHAHTSAGTGTAGANLSGASAKAKPGVFKAETLTKSVCGGEEDDSRGENFNTDDCQDGQPDYEIDERTLQLLIDTFAYDDFAKIYEKFLRARSESEICRLISQLEDFREDDRLLMILTPLLSHESVKVQNEVNGFIMRTNKHFITEEMVNIIENSEYIETVNKIDAQAEYNRPENHSYLSGSASDGAQYCDNDYDINLSVDKSVFFEQPHKLVLEAYQTNDRDRLFAISCALAQYDDPLIVEAMLYINSKLNGEISESKNRNLLKYNPIESNVLQGVENSCAPASKIIKAQNIGGGEAGINKFSFMNIDEIFNQGAPESKVNFKKLSKTLVNYKTKQSSATADSNKSSSENDYVKGIKLVNISKFAKYEECAPEVINALEHEAVYVRCCAITAIKVLARRVYRENDTSRFEELRKILMSHEIFEKNTEVASLCSKAITEIENYSTGPLGMSETGETQNSYALQLTQADGVISLARNAQLENAVNQ
jgi:hypothetical protein